MRTFYSYFRGGNGVGCGAAKAGYTDIGGVEFDASIATVCDVNFPDAPTTVMDVCAVEPGLLLNEAPTWYHASPSCKNASQAKTIEVDEDGNTVRETEQDREAGRAVARFITHWKPPMVTIENVWQYRTFEAFECIREALREAGYSYEYWHLNSADYGVPQTRKRLILVARLGLRFIQRPNPTHRQGGDMFLPAWNGWYGAIEDLIPTLPVSQFAAWQLARLPEAMSGTLVFCNNDPEWGLPYKTAELPMPSITTQTGGRTRAFIVHANDQRSMPVRDADSPMFTVAAASHNTHAPDTRPRAFLMPSVNGDGTALPRYECDPAHTCVSSVAKNIPRAFLVGEDSKMGIVSAEEPAMTTVSSHRAGNTRAWLSQGRIVKMTARALARFQSLPDTYILPERTGLACTVIGNMVCPDLAEQIAMSQP